jgi:hypothetical protein
MAWSSLPIPRSFFPRWPLRQVAAETRDFVEQRAKAVFEHSLDLMVNSLVGRESLYRLVDDIVRHLTADPWVHVMVDDIVDYIAVQPSMRELVQSQGEHLTDEVIDEARQHLVRADSKVNDWIGSARRRLHLHSRRRRRMTEQPR